MVGVANTTLITEFVLRRTAGTSIGTAVVVCVSCHNERTPRILAPLTLGAAPVPGLATGLYPS